MKNDEDFQRIVKRVMQSYNEELHDYLNSKPAGSLTDADVILMIMNLTLSIGGGIYYSLKEYLPTTPVDFDFIRVKLVNSFADTFDKIKDYNPNNVMSLTVEQLQEIKEKGSVVITMPNGETRKITADDLLIKKQDAEKTKQASNTPKLIIPSTKVVSRG